MGNTVAYCGKFEVNSVPVKIKLIFQSESVTDIYGSVYGFDMYCTKSPFGMCSTQTPTKGFEIDLDPTNQGDQNCLRKQFEGVDEHMSSLKVYYDQGQDRVQLLSSAMPHTYLEPGAKCDSDDFKFTIMDEQGNTITARRLKLKEILATTNAT